MLKSKTVLTTRVKRRNFALAVTLILIFSISTIAVFSQTSSAQVGFAQPRETQGYISVAPTLVGVGQNLTVNLWVTPLPQNYSKWPAYTGYTGIQVTFTKPDGSKDTFAPKDETDQYAAGVTEALGTMYFYYAPDKVGNWSVQFTMPAQSITDKSGTAQYAGCTSQSFSFTVQTDPVNAGLLNGHPWAPLPNENAYWTYPISPNNREWAQIAGDWLWALSSHSPAIPNTGGWWQPYGSAPSTGHILWDTQVYPGGIAGGVFGDLSYMVGASGNPIILDGKEYINYPGSRFACFDLTTGKMLYNTTGQVSAGYHAPGNIYSQSSSNGIAENVLLDATYGRTPTPYLFQNAGTSWNYYSPLTGALSSTITNVTANYFDIFDGSNLVFGITYTGFNTTTLQYNTNYAWGWNRTKVTGGDWYTGIMWKHNLNSPGHPGPGDGAARLCFTVSSDMQTVVVGAGVGDNLVAGFDCLTGNWLYNLTLPYESESVNTQLYGVNSFITYDVSNGMWRCYDCRTGTLQWATSVGSAPWNSKDTYQGNDANNLYVACPDGTVSAVNLKTGKVVWTSTPIYSTEYVNNAIPGYEFCVIAGGYVYTYLGDCLGYQINPEAREGMTICINATTGETVWTLNGGIYPSGEANGYLTGCGVYSGYLYTLGKGPTSTTVTGPKTAVSQGDHVLLQGNVLDQSPAQPGTPAVADSSMSEWMDYLNMQNATLLNSPPTPKGVSVTLTAIDPNNNFVTIGTTTTDKSGNYYFDWTPQIPGTYAVTALFSGSGSYWPSSSETGVLVTIPSATPTTAAATNSNGISDTTLYMVGAAIIIAIIVVGAATVLVLKKKP